MQSLVRLVPSSVCRVRGGRVTSDKLRLERKVGHHEYVPSARQISDPERWILTQTKYL